MSRKDLGVFIATSREDANLTQARLGEVEEQNANKAERDIIKAELAEIKQAVLRLRPPGRGRP